MKEKLGLAAQNNPNPTADFNYHAVIKLNGKYYDPSYGVTYKDLMDFQKQALAGFVKIDKLKKINLNVKYPDRTEMTRALIYHIRKASRTVIEIKEE